MEFLIIYTIVFFIILITLMILYISLNPLEIKEKKIEKFIGYEADVIEIHEPKDFQGMSPDTYEVKNVVGSTNEKYIIFKKHSSVIFPVDFPNCQILVVGGGGGGGTSMGSGGGAGGVVYITNYTLNAGTYSIIVGNGGAPMQSPTDVSTANGGNSIFRDSNNNDIITALGGAIGSSQSTTFYGTAPKSGGSGAGGTRNGITGGSGIQTTNLSISAISRTNGYGNAGGNGTNTDPWPAGGGGGAGSAGGIGSGTVAGNGGIGIQFNITGTNTYYAGGGGGGGYYDGTYNNTVAGTGGLGGGGNGSLGSATASSGIANTGGGGGGCGGDGNGNGIGGRGGSGVVIIRYTPIKIEPPPTSSRTASTIDLNPPSEMNNIPTKKEPHRPFDLSIITGTENNYTQTALNNENDSYTIKFSSYSDTNNTPSNLFNYTLVPDVSFKERRYNQKTGAFDDSLPPVPIFFNIIANDGRLLTINNSNPIVDGKIAGPSIRGEWISIKFPSPFILISYSFTAILGFENKAPGRWVILGRINNSDSSSNNPYNFIDEAPRDRSRTSWERYGNNTQTLTEYLLNNKELYNEYIFIFTMLASTDIRENVRLGHVLNFKKITMLSRVTEQ